MDLQAHWDQVYQTKQPEEVSWYQLRPELSLNLIAASGVGKDAGIIDVGGGASTLVDHLLAGGYTRLAVLDLSGSALAHARARMGPRAACVEWIESDVTRFRCPHAFGLWHDRAVFHFLTADEDRRAYVAALRGALAPGGAVIIATFAPDGPLKCSGLDVVRYSETSLPAELGPDFALEEVLHETHVTPWESEQRFIYVRLRWRPSPGPAGSLRASASQRRLPT